MILNRALGLFAAANGLMAVALGAFAAHGAGPAVKTLLTTGAHYQGLHAALAVAVALAAGGRRTFVIAGWLAAAGGLVFSLALALIAFTGATAFGAVAPVGGVLMLLGWAVLALGFFQSSLAHTAA